METMLLVPAFFDCGYLFKTVLRGSVAVQLLQFFCLGGIYFVEFLSRALSLSEQILPEL